MAGIFCYASIENKYNLSIDDFNIMFESISNKNNIGIGLFIIDIKNNKVLEMYKNDINYKECKEHVTKILNKYINKKNILYIGSTNNLVLNYKTYDKNRYKNIQPVYKNNIILAHDGYISESSVKEFENEEKISDLDSEVIINNYEKNKKDVLSTLETLSGGWAFIMYDLNKKKLITANSYLDLFQGYLTNYGFFIHSDYEAINKIFSNYRNSNFEKIFDNFYINEYKEYSYNIIDLINYNIESHNYLHKYQHPTWDSGSNDKIKYLVLFTGGLDSTSTLVYLKHLNKNVSAIYYDYGAIYQKAELEIAKKIAKKLDVDLQVSDIKNIFDSIKEIAIFMDKDKYINNNDTTTENEWICNRNSVFMNSALILAETLVLSNKCNTLYLLGGFPNIQAKFPDISKRFVDSLNKTIRFSTLPGAHNKIKIITPFINLSKVEELLLVKYLKPEILDDILSCYRAQIINKEIMCCGHNNEPACSAGQELKKMKLLAGIEDKTKYYEVESDIDNLFDYKSIKPLNITLEEILNKINL